ncbi:MAG: AAA family ATPase [Spirochaetaceae bacterium]|nr:AAA family ATPase [Spirochaetaceae bacterium]
MANRSTRTLPHTEQQYKGISEISVRGFKSLARESRIEVRPLTILAGANSSGKSSIMQPLLLMKQTLEASYDSGPLLMNGPNAKFTSADQFISRSQSNSRDFSVEIVTSDDITNKIEFSVTEAKGLEIRAMMVDVILDDVGKRSIHLTPSLAPKAVESALLRFLPEMMNELIKPGIPLVVSRHRCFLTVRPARVGRQDRLYVLPSLFTFTSGELLRMIHVPGLRGNPERIYDRTAPGPVFPGTFERYVATIIADWQSLGDDRVGRIEAMLGNLGLTTKVVADAISDTQIELQVGRIPGVTTALPNGDHVNIADVGFGVSQVLPVLVSLLVAEEGQLVYIEQPELHLHPRAQYELAIVIAEAARRGVKLVLETHSALLLLHVRTLMATGQLDRDLVKLHWFSRNPEDGMTSIQTADLDELGSFGDWPEDFGDVELFAEGAYLDAVAQRSRGNGKAVRS